jgi:hypothetical protein
MYGEANQGVYWYAWQCTRCGDSGVVTSLHPTTDERAWSAVLTAHVQRDPICAGETFGAVQWREASEQDKAVHLGRYL